MENTVYWEGFAKAAEARGVDPAVLVKIAWQIPDYGQWLVRKGQAVKRLITNARKLSTPEAGQAIDYGIALKKQITPALQQFKKLYGKWNGLSPEMKYALGGFALSALGGAIFSNGSFYDRLMKGLGYGAVGGLGAYGLKRTGALDKGIQAMRNYKNRLMAPAQVQKTQGTNLSNYDQQVAERLAGNQ